jgi:hypothetical protein
MHFAVLPTDYLYIDNEYTTKCRYYIRSNAYLFVNSSRVKQSELGKAEI